MAIFNHLLNSSICIHLQFSFFQETKYLHTFSGVFQFHCGPTFLISIDTIPTQQMFQHLWPFKKKYLVSVMYTTFSQSFIRQNQSLLWEEILRSFVVVWALLAVRRPPNHSLAPLHNRRRGKIRLKKLMGWHKNTGITH